MSELRVVATIPTDPAAGDAVRAGLAELVAATLGEQVFNYVLLNKRQEWKEYRAQVTPYELKSNLEML